MNRLTRLLVVVGVAVVAFGAAAVPLGLFSANYLPHRLCYLAKPGLIWTNVSMDFVIAASYVAIFSSLILLTVRLSHLQELRRYLWVTLAFAAFIVACGATHVMEVITIWWPVYPLSAAVKVVCAVASVATAIVFARAESKLAASVVRFVDMEAALRKANVELLELSEVDSLTGLTNRRSFDSCFASEWLRARRFETALSLLMMDIDYFKMRNDRYGHPAGDECLRRVAGVLADRRRRAEDVVARYGGEEFTLILPGANLKDAHRIAEEIRHAVAALAIPNEDAPTGRTVTMSIGVASHTPISGGEPKQLLAAADAALFEAKRMGRNRTESGHVAAI
jgi:diguanylate cyclase (GGDEF)-like protein